MEDDLGQELAANLRGEVRFDMASRAVYAGSALAVRQLPLGVVLPWDGDDTVRAFELCRARGVPIVSRGAGTSLEGQTSIAAVVIDFSKHMNAIHALDPASGSARVEPGVVLDPLRDCAEPHGLTFGPDPVTHGHCTLGGMIGNNSCGAHSARWGDTADNLHALEVLTYHGAHFTAGPTSEADFDAIARADDGHARIYRRVREFRDRWAAVIRAGLAAAPSRPDRTALAALLPENGTHVARALCRSEGTLVAVLSAELRLVSAPAARRLVALGYESAYDVAAHLDLVVASAPLGVEALDETRLADATDGELPGGHGWLLVELGAGSVSEAEARARALLDQLAAAARPPTAKLCDAAEAAALWRARESAPDALPRAAGIDLALAPESLAKALPELRALLARFGYRASLCGHLSRGCLHLSIPLELDRSAHLARFESFLEHAADLAAAHGGALCGGPVRADARARLLQRTRSPELARAFAEWKEIWDPTQRMNPGRAL